jgi:hypothetical protein
MVTHIRYILDFVVYTFHEIHENWNTMNNHIFTVVYIFQPVQLLPSDPIVTL